MNFVCYFLQLVPSVTELVVSELLFLQYNAPEKPIYMYVNSAGSQDQRNQAVGFESEAYAIIDTMNYVRSPVYTCAVGQALGNAALLVAAGSKGNRWALPNARLMTCPPRVNRAYGSTVNMMIRANELEVATEAYVDFMHDFTGKDKSVLRKDVGRNRYFTPEQAMEYGLIDKVVQAEDALRVEGKDYEAMLKNCYYWFC